MAAIAVVAIATTGVVLVTRQDSRPAAPPGRAAIDGVTLVADAASPIGLVALADGGFRYGERRSGAIREVVELILKAQGRWAEVTEKYLKVVGS